MLGRGFRNEGISGRRPQAFAHSVCNPCRQHLPPRTGETDHRFRYRRQAVAKKSERLAFSGSIRYSTRIKLQQAGGGFRQTLNEAHCPRRRAKDLCE